MPSTHVLILLAFYLICENFESILKVKFTTILTLVKDLLVNAFFYMKIQKKLVKSD